MAGKQLRKSLFFISAIAVAVGLFASCFGLFSQINPSLYACAVEAETTAGDQDSDGLPDAAETEKGTNPQMADTDGDGLTDGDEVHRFWTDPARPDTDGDGYADGLEITNGYSPKHGDAVRLVNVDSDKDYLNDAWELAAGTDLSNPDSDGDLYLDGTEVAASYDPLNPAPLKLAKRIEVDLKAQKLAYFFGEKLFEEFLISGGKPWSPTPVGDFSVLKKVPVKHYGGNGFDYPNTKWNLMFARKKLNYYIHGAYWHSNWGKPMSHGCVNVSYDRMERLYWWAQVGTPVEIKA